MADTLKQALVLELALMAVMVASCQLWTSAPIGWFTAELRVAQAGVTYLRVVSWNLFGVGIVFACSGMFQALGNTLPALASSALRLAAFALPAWWWSRQPDFQLLDVWHLSVASVFVQAIVSLALVRRRMRPRREFS